MNASIPIKNSPLLTPPWNAFITQNKIKPSSALSLYNRNKMLYTIVAKSDVAWSIANMCYCNIVLFDWQRNVSLYIIFLLKPYIIHYRIEELWFIKQVSSKPGIMARLRIILIPSMILVLKFMSSKIHKSYNLSELYIGLWKSHFV